MSSSKTKNCLKRKKNKCTIVIVIISSSSITTENNYHFQEQAKPSSSSSQKLKSVAEVHTQSLQAESFAYCVPPSVSSPAGLHCQSARDRQIIEIIIISNLPIQKLLSVDVHFIRIECKCSFS